MGTIASLDIVLGTNLKKFSDGLKKVTAEATSFVGSVGDKLGAIPIKEIGVALAGLGAGIATGLASLTSSGLDRIDELADTAQRIGITTDKLSELRHAANLTGSAAEDLDAALQKMNQNLGDTSEDGGKAGAALKGIGLDASVLKNIDPAEAFKRIVEGYQSLTNASDKTRFAMDVFGKGGVKILNTLGSGSEQIAALAEEARKLGISVSSVDAAKIGAAKDALDRAGGAVQGISNTLAIELSPIIETVAAQFTKWTGDTVTNGGVISGAFEKVAGAVAYIGDVAFDLEKAIQGVFANIIDGAGNVLDFFGGSGKGAHEIAANFRKDIERTFNVKPSEKLATFLAEVKSKAQSAAEESAKLGKSTQGGASNGLAKSIEDVTDKLKEQIDTFGKTASEIDIYKLAQQGATKEQLASIQAQSDQLKALDKTKKKEEELKDFAKKTKEDMLSPLQKFQAEFDKIDEAVYQGLLTKDEGTKAARKSFKDNSADGGPAKFAGALEMGSNEARSAVLAATTGGGQNLMVDFQKQTNANIISGNKFLADIAKSVGVTGEIVQM